MGTRSASQEPAAETEPGRAPEQPRGVGGAATTPAGLTFKGFVGLLGPGLVPLPEVYADVLGKAREWIGGVEGWTHLKTKAASVSGSTAPVGLYKTGSEGLVWVGRVSRHEDAAVEGAASWGEFDGGIRVAHSRNEGAYTPDVYTAVELWSGGVSVEGWKGVEVAVYEMYHSIPLLNDRFFTTCVITAQHTDTDSIVVQLPFDINTLPEEFKQRSQRHPTQPSPKFEYKPTQSEGSYQDDEAAKKKDGVSLVEGRYVSVEYISVGNTGRDGQSEVTWKMATASDAAGKIPQFVTNTSLPGQVINDVPWFLNWVHKRRNQG